MPIRVKSCRPLACMIDLNEYEPQELAATWLGSPFSSHSCCLAWWSGRTPSVFKWHPGLNTTLKLPSKSYDLWWGRSCAVGNNVTTRPSSNPGDLEAALASGSRPHPTPYSCLWGSTEPPSRAECLIALMHCPTECGHSVPLTWKHQLE